ncbi:MAG: DUF6076 domain-containing protein [Clostridia bacterium]
MNFDKTPIFKIEEKLREHLNSLEHNEKILPVWTDEIEILHTYFITIDSFLKLAPPYKDVIEEQYTKTGLLFGSREFFLAAEPLIEMYADGIDVDFTITEFTQLVHWKIKQYDEIILALHKVDGFYSTFLDEFYHSSKKYPKSNDIAEAFEKYINKYDINYSIYYTTPKFIKFESKPTIYTTSDKSKIVVGEIFSYETLEALLYRDFIGCIKNEVMPKRCKNFGKYYIPNFGYYSEYCDNIAPNETTKTCRDIGIQTAFGQKLKDNPVLFEYQKAYKTHHARFVKKKMSKDELENWKIFANDLKEKTLNGELNFEDFLKQIKK